MSVDELEHEDGLMRRHYNAAVTKGDGRTVDVRIVPYGEIIEHNDGYGDVPRGVMYREEYVRGAFDHQLSAANRVVANYEHQKGLGGMVGHGVTLRDEADGFYGSFRILRGDDGDKLLELVDAGVIDGVSLEAEPVRARKSPAGVVQRVKANLFAVAFTRFGAYAGARILAVRTAPVIEDEFPPFPEVDPERVRRWRAMGIELPQRLLEAHPDEQAPPDGSGTPGTAPATGDDNISRVEE